jgi:uncharacterized glyoxalase superfamily protein PhnB
MLSNRSMLKSVVIPQLAYRDVGEAVSWLCSVFGFKEHMRIGNHRAQLTFPGGGSLVLTQGVPEQKFASGGYTCHRVMVRISDVDSHHRHATQRGTKILSPPKDYPYGERQYSAEDLGGHIWDFSQSIADVDPASWGGDLLET